MSSNIIIWNNSKTNNPWGFYLATPLINYISASNAEQSAFMFDIRVMDRAISVSGGKAADAGDLGTVGYVYDDMINNGGKVHLPFG